MDIETRTGLRLAVLILAITACWAVIGLIGAGLYALIWG